MSRVVPAAAAPFVQPTRTITHPGKRRKVLDRARGFVGRSKNILGAATRRTNKAGQYAYRDRRTKKREFRASWIRAVNAAARQHGGVKYSELVHALAAQHIALNRKMLAELAIAEPLSFAKLVDHAKPAVLELRRAHLARTAAQHAGVVAVLGSTHTLEDVAREMRRADALRADAAAAASK